MTLRISRGHGFQLAFENGVTVSVQFGASHYCANRFKGWEAGDTWSCENAEVAVFYTEGEWLTREVFAQLDWEDPEDDVAGYIKADEVAKLISACQAWPKREEVEK